MNKELDTIFIAIFDVLALLLLGFIFSLITGLINLNIIEFLYLVYKRELFHYLEKRNLVHGDTIFIEIRGGIKKASVTSNSKHDKTIQARFDDKEITLATKEYNNYAYARIYVPKFLSHASKILFGIRKDK